MEKKLSPKHSALAYDEIKEHAVGPTMDFEPEINLIIDKLSVKSNSSSPIIMIGGRVTVSF